MPDETDDNPQTTDASAVDASLEEQSPSLIRQEVRTEFSGPLPPPMILEGYERLIPGAAERLLLWAETEGRHQRELEAESQAAMIQDQREERAERRRGQQYGLGIGLFGIGAGVWLAIEGHTGPASVLLGSTLLGLVAVFVAGRYFGSEDEE